MSSYQDGYYRGHQDAIDGSRNICEGGLIFDLLSELSNDDNQDDWEEGYRSGYEAGEKELEE
ncbi:MAG: hypothetical protein CEN87_430 [Parcubacteria group bacterium Licking1014_1]|nr:MAG: hypothetical protein CEN87_430 [Parcubacteria group bacterium Licking1014_1]